MAALAHRRGLRENFWNQSTNPTTRRPSMPVSGDGVVEWASMYGSNPQHLQKRIGKAFDAAPK